jgi:hypothetical protein
MIFPPPDPPEFRRHPQTVVAWLDIAMRDLVPSAKARIRPEIEAHFAEALRTHLRDGLPPPAAQAAALGDLGDASSAAARFRQEHLTTREAALVAFRAHGARRTSGLMFYAALVSLLFAILMSLLLVAAWAYVPKLGIHSLLFPANILGFVLVYASLSIAADVLARRRSLLAGARPIFWLGTFQVLSLNIMTLPCLFSLLVMQESNPFSGLPFPYLDLITKGACWMGIAGTLITAVSFVVGMIQVDSRLRKKLAAARDADFPSNSLDSV